MTDAGELSGDSHVSSSPEEASRWFPQTQWALVAAARREGPEAQRAREELCRMYWEPLWWFARARGKQDADAKDAVQAFLADFLGKHGGFGLAEEEKGSLRTYLLACFTNHMIVMWREAGAQRRGSGEVPVPYEEGAHAPVNGETPENIYDRKWAQMIMNAALQRLKEECQAEGREEEYRMLGPLITEGRSGRGECIEAARRLGVPEGTARAKLFRLRGRCRRVLLETVGATMGRASEEDVLAELKVLMEWGRHPA